MKAPVSLKTFTHVVYSSAVMAGKEPVQGIHNENNASLLTADINFEQGIFRLEGDWHYMMTCNKHTEPGWFNYHQQRITIKAGICPGCSIDLLDDNNDGAVFIIEGNIKDNNDLTACSGLLVLDKTTGNNRDVDTWNISFYLYDNDNDDVEIAIKIPVLVYPPETRLN